MSKVGVLDRGYVRLTGVLGDDLTVVNSARVSFNKESEWVHDGPSIISRQDELLHDPVTVLEETKCLKHSDKRLLKYLAEHSHFSPFRHCVLSFEVYAPLMVMRQIGKYRVGSSFVFEDDNDSLETWNESSRRYVTEEPEFYIPDVWRSAPEHKKQGSGRPASNLAQGSSEVLDGHIAEAITSYYWALNQGVCAEQARLFLPAYAMYIRARWTVSLQGVIHFLQQRLGEDSQWEIQQYAKAVLELAKPKFPESMEVWGL